jgi:ABC-2 type transport system permease protein
MRKVWTFSTKDIKLFFADPRAAIITVLVPIAIACFMVMIFGGMSSPQDQSKKKLDVLLVDLDDTQLSRDVVQALVDGSLVHPMISRIEEAVAKVRKGESSVALVIPKGFGDQAPQAMFFGDKPEIKIYYDPSQSTNVQIVNGAVMQSVMQTVSRSAFSADNVAKSRDQILSSGLDDKTKVDLSKLFDDVQNLDAGGGAVPAMQEPFTVKTEPLVASDEGTDQWATKAHIFAGMAVQGVLFFGIEAGMAVMRDRRQGIWKRLKASPIKQSDIVLGKGLSATLTALFVLCAVFLAGFLIFRIHVTGSWIGFASVMAMTAVTTACFGLFLAALGRTEQQSRGFAVLAVLMMSMLGGAWFPSFLMPEWVQKAAMFVPVKWSVDGFDAFLWRQADLTAVAAPVLGLSVFSLVFGGIALMRFKKMQEA